MRQLITPIAMILTFAFSAALVLHASAAPPNVVFILADDLGWMDLGCYGTSFYESPSLDRLAAEGMKFTRAYTAGSVCSPTRSSIVTSQYPARNGCTNYGGSVKGTEHGLAKALGEGGYETFFVGKWHIGRLSPQASGFQSVGNVTTSKGEDPKGTRSITRSAVEFISKKHGRPFFAYVCYHAVHTPLLEDKATVAKYRARAAKLEPPGEPLLGKEHDRGMKLRQDTPEFAAMVEVMDRGVGEILEAIRQSGVERNTLVIFFSDNGGLSTRAFGGVYPTSNLPLRAGKGWLYEGGIRVPLIVRLPGVVEPGSVCDMPITSTDFYPTLLELAELPLRPKDHADGQSVAGLLRGEEGSARDILYWHYPHQHGAGCPPSGAVRVGDWKLIEYFSDGTVELYNTADDIGEKNNLAAKLPEKRDALLEKLKAYQNSIPDIRFGK